jgi:hypothetical protein
VFLKHLIDVAEEQQANGTDRWLAEQISIWRVVACVQDYGLTVDEGKWSAEQQSMFIRLAKEACSRIGQRDSFTPQEVESWDVLDGKGISPRGAAEIDTAPIIELGEAIVAVVTGVLPEAPTGTVWFFGAETGRRTIRMSDEYFKQ